MGSASEHYVFPKDILLGDWGPGCLDFLGKHAWAKIKQTIRFGIARDALNENICLFRCHCMKIALRCKLRGFLILDFVL